MKAVGGTKAAATAKIKEGADKVIKQVEKVEQKAGEARAFMN